MFGCEHGKTISSLGHNEWVSVRHSRESAQEAVQDWGERSEPEVVKHHMRVVLRAAECFHLQSLYGHVLASVLSSAPSYPPTLLLSAIQRQIQDLMLLSLFFFLNKNHSSRRSSLQAYTFEEQPTLPVVSFILFSQSSITLQLFKKKKKKNH